MIKQEVKKAKVQTRLDVIPHDLDVTVAVRAFVLVVEAQSMEQLVLDSVVVNAAILLQGQIL